MTEQTMYQEPTYKAPEVVQRKGDGLWVVWVWEYKPLVLDESTAPPEAHRKWDFESPWITGRLGWQMAGVYGTKGKALRAAERWERSRNVPRH